MFKLFNKNIYFPDAAMVDSVLEPVIDCIIYIT